jgi:hypothetical protein
VSVCVCTCACVCACARAYACVVAARNILFEQSLESRDSGRVTVELDAPVLHHECTDGHTLYY